MNRRETTKLLTEIVLAQPEPGCCFAQEVVLNYGTTNVKRIDIMRFKPYRGTYASDIEKGIFTCYEIKSCVEDIYSGNGLNFFGELNYIVTTMDTYKKLLPDIENNTLRRHIQTNHPESSDYFGIMVPVPANADLRKTQNKRDVFIHPAPFEGPASAWKLYNIVKCSEGPRKKSMNELLYCMLRSGKSHIRELPIT